MDGMRIVTTKMSDEEYAQIEAKAPKGKVSTYMRALALGMQEVEQAGSAASPDWISLMKCLNDDFLNAVAAGSGSRNDHAKWAQYLALLVQADIRKSVPSETVPSASYEGWIVERAPDGSLDGWYSDEYESMIKVIQSPNGKQTKVLKKGEPGYEDF